MKRYLLTRAAGAGLAAVCVAVLPARIAWTTDDDQWTVAFFWGTTYFQTLGPGLTYKLGARMQQVMP